MEKRKHISSKIEQLDWKYDYEEIVYLLTSHVFPWDYQKSLEFALFRTYAVPSISKLLSKTGEFRDRTRKRYDDTELILSEIMENGLDSEQAKAAFRRMNKMHNSYSISNDDFLYVLATFVFVPIKWIDTYCWRKLTENEKRAIYKFQFEVGKRMGIKNIPKDLQTYESFFNAYEVRNFRKTATTEEISKYTLDLLLGFYLPKQLWFLGKPFLQCFMDRPLLNAVNLKEPPELLKKIVLLSMQIRSKIIYLLPERKKPFLRTKLKRPTYPNGYKIEELGTFPEKEFGSALKK